MRGTKLVRWLLLGLTVAMLLVPIAAFAQDATAEGEGAPAAEAKELKDTEWQIQAAMALAAGLAMGLSALGAGIAQGKIGAAAAGALAERPELFTNVLVFLVLPEIILLLGFVVATMLTP